MSIEGLLNKIAKIWAIDVSVQDSLILAFGDDAFGYGSREIHFDNTHDIVRIGEGVDYEDQLKTWLATDSTKPYVLLYKHEDYSKIVFIKMVGEKLVNFVLELRINVYDEEDQSVEILQNLYDRLRGEAPESVTPFLVLLVISLFLSVIIVLVFGGFHVVKTTFLQSFESFLGTDFSKS